MCCIIEIETNYLKQFNKFVKIEKIFKEIKTYVIFDFACWFLDGPTGKEK